MASDTQGARPDDPTVPADLNFNGSVLSSNDEFIFHGNPSTDSDGFMNSSMRHPKCRARTRSPLEEGTGGEDH